MQQALYAPHLWQVDRVRLAVGGAADAPIAALTASVLRALLLAASNRRAAGIGSDVASLTLTQLAYISPETPGSFGLAFEVAVHEAINARQPEVCSLVSEAMAGSGVLTSRPRSLLFGAERAAKLGYLEALVQDLGEQPVLRIGAQRRGRPFSLSRWLPHLAQGWRGEAALPSDIAKAWKADLLLADAEGSAFVTATVKSNALSLEGGPGLQLGIVPQIGSAWPPGVRTHKGLQVAILPDDGQFLQLLDAAHQTVMFALAKLTGRPLLHRPVLAASKRLAEELIRWGDYPVAEVVATLTRRGQRDLVSESMQDVLLSGVSAIEPGHVRVPDLIELESGLLVPKSAM